MVSRRLSAPLFTWRSSHSTTCNYFLCCTMHEERQRRSQRSFHGEEFDNNNQNYSKGNNNNNQNYYCITIIIITILFSLLFDLVSIRLVRFRYSSFASAEAWLCLLAHVIMGFAVEEWQSAMAQIHCQLRVISSVEIPVWN